MIVIFFIFQCFVFACKKETIVPITAGELTAVELQKVIQERGVKRVYAYDDNTGFPTTFFATTGGSWTFSNGFITITGNSLNRNLLYLDRYTVNNINLDDGSQPLALLLHFIK